MNTNESLFAKYDYSRPLKPMNEKLSALAEAAGVDLKNLVEQQSEVTQKKSDLVDHLFKSGVGFEAMPLNDVVIPYAEADVLACMDVYIHQMKEFEEPQNDGLMNIVELMNNNLLFLVEVEWNGIKIDEAVLQQIEDDYRAEETEIERRLQAIVREVMGDKIYNLKSGQDLTEIIYSRTMVDRTLHAKVWRIGTDSRGKPLFPPNFKNAQDFGAAIKKTTTYVEKTRAVACQKCHKRGIIYKIKKNGDPFKKPSKCPDCNGQGALFLGTGEIAGFQLNPQKASWASANGFKSDKKTIELLLGQARRKNNELAVEFLTKLKRLSAISVYLDSFIKGLKQWMKWGYAHPNFNQCITATGRLSSSNPNWQNIPVRGFPIRKAVVSRFEGGSITETDFSSLEFRVAVELSRDKQGIKDIAEGKDVHRQTGSIIFKKSAEEVTKEERQQSKAHTFAPLYGSSGYLYEPYIKAYYDSFFELYQGIGAYQDKCKRGVLKDGIVQTPSGRQYFWPDAERRQNGQVTFSTQICNYPIQGFATGDIVPLACIRALRTFREHGLLSKIILTVHDSIVVDTHPDEISQVEELLTQAMVGVSDEIRELWGYEMIVPMECETAVGKSWADCK